MVNRAKRLTALAFLALASSAAAHIYTCEEGRFTIELPDGAEVSALYGSTLYDPYRSGIPGINAKGVDIYGPGWQVHIIWSTNTEDYQYFSLEAYHDGYVKGGDLEGPLVIDKYIDGGEARRMNVDAGFVLRSDREHYFRSVFVKGKRFYDLSGLWGEAGMEDVIRIFNSFRALD